MPTLSPSSQSVNINEPLCFRRQTVQKFSGAREGASSDSCLVMCVVLIFLTSETI